jgi:hypothetical protein
MGYYKAKMRWSLVQKILKAAKNQASLALKKLKRGSILCIILLANWPPIWHTECYGIA